VSFDDLFADGQTNAGTGEFFPFMQPLKHAKYSFEILLFDSEAVVLYGE